MTLHGIDCSDYDFSRGPMDIGAMAKAGISWLTHKATESTNTQHSHYGEALRRARDAGIPVLGAYGVPRTPGNGGAGSVSAQVDYFLAYVDSQTPWWRTWPDWMFQCDLEHWPYDQVPPQVGVQWSDLVTARTGRTVILYAPRWAYGDTIGGAHPLWQSAYGSNPTTDFKTAYPGDQSDRWAAYSGRVPVILQYGSQTRIGTQPGCDANAFRGSLDQLRALIRPAGDGMFVDEKYPAGFQEDPDKQKRQPWQHLRDVAQAVEFGSTATWLGRTLTDLAADVAALKARPAATLTDTQLHQVIDALIAAPHVPLTAADREAMISAAQEAMRRGAGTPTP